MQRLVREMFADAPRPAPVQQAARPAADNQSQTGGILIADGRNVFQGGRQLSPNEVRNLMAYNIEAIQLYNQGMQRKKVANGFMIVGAVGTVVGFLPLIQGPDNEYTPYGGETYYNYSFGQNLQMIFGLGAGASLVVTGIILNQGSKKIVGQSVNAYNHGSSRTSLELDFGITGNGVGVVLRF